MKVYKLIVNSDDLSGMDAISLVESPAVEVNFLAFNKAEEYIKLSNEKREITGVVCLADTPIFRRNKSFGEHYIVFTKEVIKSMMLKYFKMGLGNNVNIEHEDMMVDGVTMIESYLTDKQRGIAPVEFNVPDGSWIATFKVENDEIWEKIVSMKSLKGFSLQGLFEYGDCINLSKQETYEEWLDELVKL